MIDAAPPQLLTERTYRSSYGPEAGRGSQTSDPSRMREIQIKIGQSAAPWLLPAFRRIEALTALAHGWDSYGGQPVAADAAMGAVRFLAETAYPELPEPAVVPLADGGVQIEWHRGGLDIEVTFSDEHAGMYVEDLAGGEAYERSREDARAELLRLMPRLT
jgi:hypothetical protein